MWGLLTTYDVPITGTSLRRGSLQRKWGSIRMRHHRNLPRWWLALICRRRNGIQRALSLLFRSEPRQDGVRVIGASWDQYTYIRRLVSSFSPSASIHMGSHSRHQRRQLQTFRYQARTRSSIGPQNAGRHQVNPSPGAVRTQIASQLAEQFIYLNLTRFAGLSHHHWLSQRRRRTWVF